MIPVLTILFFLFFYSLHYRTEDYRTVSLIISILFILSIEFYYIGVNREDLERRHGFSIFEMKERNRKEIWWQLIINDGRTLVLTGLVIYFLNIYLTGRLIPINIHDPFAESGDNFFAYMTVIFLMSTIPENLKHRREITNSLEIEKDSSERVVSLLEKAGKVRGKNNILFAEFMKQINEEAKIVNNENRFQFIVREGKSAKEELFKIGLAILFSLV